MTTIPNGFPIAGAMAIATVALCPADLDGDGQVGVGDILAILAAWGPCDDCPEDLDASGVVDFGDVLEVLSAWGPCEG